MKRICQILPMASLMVALFLAPHIACAQAPVDPVVLKSNEVVYGASLLELISFTLHWEISPSS